MNLSGASSKRQLKRWNPVFIQAFQRLMLSVVFSANIIRCFLHFQFLRYINATKCGMRRTICVFKNYDTDFKKGFFNEITSHL